MLAGLTFWTNGLTYNNMARCIVIGICASIETAWWGGWSSDREAVILPRTYIDAVERAGACAIVVPPHQVLRRNIEELYRRIDGMVLAGGSDLDPSCFGAERHPAVVVGHAERDAFELAVARYSLESGRPLLGICRGMQVMNVAGGGTLNQHLPDTLGHKRHCPTPGTFEASMHEVRLQPGSLASMLAGAERLTVTSHHHQGLDRVGDGFTVTGWASLDDLPEAIEANGLAPTVGVQWHPEADASSAFVERFVAMIRSQA